MSTQNLEIPSSVQLVDDAKEQPAREIPQVSLPVNIVKAPNKKREFYSALSEIQAELEDLHSILASIRKGQTIIPTYADILKPQKQTCGI